MGSNWGHIFHWGGPLPPVEPPLGPVTTWMGDCLRADKASRYVTNHLDQLSLLALRAGVKAGRALKIPPTTSQMRHYTIWWNINVRKLVCIVHCALWQSCRKRELSSPDVGLWQAATTVLHKMYLLQLLLLSLLVIVGKQFSFNSFSSCRHSLLLLRTTSVRSVPAVHSQSATANNTNIMVVIICIYGNYVLVKFWFTLCHCCVPYHRT